MTRSTKTLTLVIVTLLIALLLGDEHSSARAAAAPAHILAGPTGSSRTFRSFRLFSTRAAQGRGCRRTTSRRARWCSGSGANHWAGFDLDLLRVAAIWRGHGVTPTALAPGSYQRPDRKTPGGQNGLPEPDGRSLARQRHLSRLAGG